MVDRRMFEALALVAVLMMTVGDAWTVCSAPPSPMDDPQQYSAPDVATPHEVVLLAEIFENADGAAT